MAICWVCIRAATLYKGRRTYAHPTVFPNEHAMLNMILNNYKKNNIVTYRKIKSGAGLACLLSGWI